MMKDTPGMDPTLTYNVSAGAVITGMNRAKELQLYDPKIINITWVFRIFF
jgi:hypothetical protein